MLFFSALLFILPSAFLMGALTLMHLCGLSVLDFRQWQDISFFAFAFYQLAQLKIIKTGFSVLLFAFFKNQKS